MAWPKKGRKLPSNWYSLRRIVLYNCRFICEICKKARATEVDHIRPVSSGGTDDLDNLQGLCADCHAKKSSNEGLIGRGIYTSDYDLAMEPEYYVNRYGR